MTHVDVEEMKRIVDGLYVHAAEEAFSTAGMDALRFLLDKVARIHQLLSTEVVSHSLAIFIKVEDSGSVDPISFDAEFLEIEHLCQDYDKLTDGMIELLRNGSVKYRRGIQSDLKKLSQHSIVYLYRDRNDIFVINGSEYHAPKPIPGYPSVFAVPAFAELRKALEDYKRRVARACRCPILASCWHGSSPSKRLFFSNKPEAILRRSLEYFLSIVLPGADVRPEQVVDESHPVDIRVNWIFTNRLALVELKWLGKSKNEQNKITTEYTQSRAQEGAKQLADYLDANRPRAPLTETRGYLVIIDARRRGLREAAEAISHDDGFWYQSQEIEFDPDYAAVRNDFERPIRMFVEPVCNAS